MLFSQPQVAAFLNENFECAWESLRPVPKVTVDFGNGTVLERTLLGNIATWYCDADGRVLDVLPGLCDADEYLARAREGRAMAAAQRARPQGWAGMQRLLQIRAHDVERSSSPALRNRADISKLGVEAPLRAPFERRVPDVSKRIVEGPLRAGLGDGTPGPAAPDLGKRRVEQPIRAAGGLDGVAADTAFNRAVRYAQAWRLLAAQPAWPTPASVHEALFDEVLHVPLDDPFLGLAPDVPGGEGGRRIGGS